ncbi:hypothetical protein DL89DRAFT_301886 [Linderina pennispora]|uniref:P-loop containing nucleoside triphosphate hydrolase protein n=1 Tax=Linderina pennispora TaxID=61395 RepID=A0A1Y1W3Y6_9FUNG|nr:uncharacterized protein DL89DRAFT_301886 [Linderina pennispora]ORX68280.1 hypothetical protein DL89DRAFT_301886 [Linderina pennispora]
MRMVSEAIGNFKAVKLYAWERAFMAKIEGIRNNEELAAVRKMGVSKVLIAFTGGLTSIVVTLGTFGAYMIFGCESHGPLTSQLIFVSLSLFFLLQEPVSGWPRALSSFVTASRSYDRLNAFLMCPDRDPEAISRLEYDRYRESASANDVLVDVSGASFKWNACEGTALEDISFECRREELVAVIGKVATLCGSVAFVPQQPWIVNTTLRNNILFGNKLEQEFYDRVIDACALRADLVTMSGGDMTEIGEKGFNLSGGQKARVALARAVYARADIYLLDDPLSAVDVQVGKHIFSHVLGPTGLLRNRARILATNNLQDLRGVDRVLLLQDGRLVTYGTFTQTTNFPQRAAETGIWVPAVAERTSMVAEANVVGRQCTIGRAERNSTWVDNNRGIHTSATGEHVIIKDDVEHFGQVGVDVFRHYVRACGAQNVAWLLLSVIATMLLVMGGSFWLAHWAHTNEENKQPSQPVNSLYHLLIYAAIGAGSGVSSMVTLVLLWLVCASDGSRRIHSQILHSIFQVPISLLDSIPTGRILGLFGSDLAKVDIVIPGCVDIWVQSGIGIAVSIILISMTSLFSLLFLPPLVYLFVSIQKRSIPATRDVRRLINKSRDTIITGIEEAVHGAVSIRAYSQERRFEVSSEAKIERYMAALWTYECADRWLIFRLDSICVAILLFVAFMLVGIQHFSGRIDSGFASLTLTYAMSMLGMVNICLRSSALLEMSMVSVERLRDYSFLESEEQVAASGHSGPPCWPETGDIEFRNYSTSQKVGIVGRTGAGKSSLALALLRIIEPDSGQILLDGQDISKCPLHDVRSRVSIIPQDPVMFSGTVRENLDPFGSYSDGEIWRALDNSHMGEFIRSKNERLESVVTQGGENFSVGQRQLICFARALLRRTKILVLDEATSAIDASTDTAIQQTIRKEFKSCTVLTIAHRLSTVLDSDRVLVIDRGRAVEYDSPQKLLANSCSMLSQLVADTKDKSCK